MAERTIIWTETASRQLREVLHYWNKRNNSKSFSKKLIDRIFDNLDGIKRYPESCPETSVVDVRVSALGHYSIFYFYSESEIVIVSFWDNRQDPEKLKALLNKTQGNTGS